MQLNQDKRANEWGDAFKVAAIFAIDPIGLKGIHLRAPAGDSRDVWLEYLRDVLPSNVSMRRIPVQVNDARLLGGLDLAATLAVGRPVAERGLLSECNGGIAVVAMAERMPIDAAARFASALDKGEVAVERDGMSMKMPSDFGVILLDEGIGADEGAASALEDRVAFKVQLPPTAMEPLDVQNISNQIARARDVLSSVRVNNESIEVLTATAFTLGVAGLRAPMLAVKVAQAHACFHKRLDVIEEDLQFAARSVLATRATRLPAYETDEVVPQPEDSTDEPNDDDESASPPEPPENEDVSDVDIAEASKKPLEDVVLEAAVASIPAGLLIDITNGRTHGRARSRGRAGKLQRGSKSGRPVGVKSGSPGSGGRLNVLATLRAAAPWQAIRRRESEISGKARSYAPPLHIRREDFRISRYQQRTETTTIFAIDASGSSALHRLAEAKGAIELLLAECYVRRDRVAVVAFRGSAAEILLPPTRSLVRAKRGLAGLPGGGGTPLASGIDAARILALAAERRGETPLVVVLTDGRANVGRDGLGGRAKAEADALAAARAVCFDRLPALVIDTSRGGEPQAVAVAKAMAAKYLRLPHSDARQLSNVVAQVSSDVVPRTTHG